jgi:hypothetical protein
MKSPAARTVAAVALTPFYLLLPRGGMQIAMLTIIVAAVLMVHRERAGSHQPDQSRKSPNPSRPVVAHALRDPAW